jgi:hypothetical protein
LSARWWVVFVTTGSRRYGYRFRGMRLPQCVVCGQSVGLSGDWPSTFDEAEATELLGHAPPEERSVVDPKYGKPRWVGHEDCTGLHVRTFERSGSELLNRLKRQANKNLQAQRNADLRSRASVKCQVCGQPLRLRFFRRTEAEVVVATIDALDGIALACRSCGRVHCADCALKDLPQPSCRWCGKSVTVLVRE